MSIFKNQLCSLLVLFGFMFLAPLDTFSQGKVNYRKVAVLDSAIGYASFYADKFIGKKMANGKIFSQKKMTCAHNTFPMGTILRVTNLSNKLFVDVMVTDRLHHRNPRLVDLTKSAAKQIKLDQKGVSKVMVKRIYPPKSR